MGSPATHIFAFTLPAEVVYEARGIISAYEQFLKNSEGSSLLAENSLAS